jgi:hypothetical protein
VGGKLLTHDLLREVAAQRTKPAAKSKKKSKTPAPTRDGVLEANAVAPDVVYSVVV